jgi:hypothetical protein
MGYFVFSYMKHVVNILVLGFILISFSNCSKDKESNEVSSALPKVPKIKTKEEKSSFSSITYSYNYEYDSYGRLIKEYRSKTGIKNYQIVTCIYPSLNLIILIDSSKFNDTVSYFIKDTMHLNSKGYVILEKGQYSSTNYSYDSLGFQLSKNGKNIVVNGNLIQSEEVNNTNYFEFYLDKINTIGYFNFGAYFWGKSNQNLIKKYTRSDNNNSYTNTYEFDEKGRVTKQVNIDIYIGGSDTTITSYSYY